MKLTILFVILVMVQVHTEPCLTPNNESAQCISLYECPTLLKGLQSQEVKVIEFLEQSHCGTWTNDPLVCCGTRSNFVKQLFFDKYSCGFQHSDDYYRPDFIKPTFDEYPWLALFKYEDDFSSKRCAGSLINSRYVLTAAQCLDGNPSAVRLGEYNLKHENDCVKDGDYLACSDKVLDVKIENKLLHPLYHAESKQNDIALVRLERIIVYSDYIRPICLPSDDHVITANDKMFATGFGLKNYEGQFVAVKKKVLLTLLSNEVCSNTTMCNNKTRCYNMLCVKELNYTVDHICNGDYGGPLMFSENIQWYLEGLYSWSLHDCDSQQPAYFTNVSKYLDWIKDNVRF